jgi:hypothetical protein
MPLQWNTLLKTGYEWYLEPDFDRSGQLLPAPLLADESLMVPERVLRDTLERERCSLQLIVRSQSQRESDPNTSLESSVTGGLQYQLRQTSRHSLHRPNSRQFQRFPQLSPLRMIRHHLRCVATRTATRMTMTTTETE